MFREIIVLCCEVQKFYCRVHKSSLLVPVIRQISPVHINATYFLKVDFDTVVTPTPTYS
jgi:hypothetical protein